VACIYRFESENISEEGAIRLRVFAAHDYVGTEDHEPYLGVLFPRAIHVYIVM
jgi:hypothetical protein